MVQFAFNSAGEKVLSVIPATRLIDNPIYPFTYHTVSGIGYRVVMEEDHLVYVDDIFVGIRFLVKDPVIMALECAIHKLEVEGLLSIDLWNEKPKEG